MKESCSACPPSHGYAHASWCQVGILSLVHESYWESAMDNTVPPTSWWFGTFFIFPSIGNNHSNWLIFFRRVETTNQWWLMEWVTRIMIQWIHLYDCSWWLHSWNSLYYWLHVSYMSCILMEWIIYEIPYLSKINPSIFHTESWIKVVWVGWIVGSYYRYYGIEEPDVDMVRGI